MQPFRVTDVGLRALEFHSSRHSVIASNIANVDTPGFQAFELVRDPDALAAMDSGAQEHTEQTPTRLIPEGVVPSGSDGNNVSLEYELSKLGANQLQYETCSRIVQQLFAQLRYASSDGMSG